MLYVENSKDPIPKEGRIDEFNKIAGIKLACKSQLHFYILLIKNQKIN